MFKTFVEFTAPLLRVNDPTITGSITVDGSAGFFGAVGGSFLSSSELTGETYPSPANSNPTSVAYLP